MKTPTHSTFSHYRAIVHVRRALMWKAVVKASSILIKQHYGLRSVRGSAY